LQAIYRKLFRDFQRLWIQAIAIAVVLSCGVAILLTSVGMFVALSETRTAYYERNRFADVFAHTVRAPLSLVSEIAQIDGVAGVEARISGTAILDIPGRTRTAVGRILSYPEKTNPVLNLPLLIQGRFPDPAVTSEIVVNAPFAEANNFRPGDSFSANLRGQKRSFTIVGAVQSPEFVYTIGLGAYDRTDHQSDAFLEAELSHLKGMAAILPPVFFAISGFLVSMVMSRIIALERSEVGLMKAIGYSNTEVCQHYLMLAGLIALVGVLIGWVAGTILARSLAVQYATFFNFPYVIFHVSYWVYAAAGLAGLATTSLGALQAALKAARLAQSTIMILRCLLRWPVRSLLTSLGLALAVASVNASIFINDALDEFVDLTFYQTNRQDAMLLFAEDIPEAVLEEVSNLPGVLHAESPQFQAAILRKGHLRKRVAIDSRRPGADLNRVLDIEGRPLDVPPGGILLSRRLAGQLGVHAGDTLQAEFLTGRRETYSLTVTGLVDQLLGLGA